MGSDDPAKTYRVLLLTFVIATYICKFDLAFFTPSTSNETGPSLNLGAFLGSDFSASAAESRGFRSAVDVGLGVGIAFGAGVGVGQGIGVGVAVGIGVVLGVGGGVARGAGLIVGVTGVELGIRVSGA